MDEIVKTDRHVFIGEIAMLLNFAHDVGGCVQRPVFRCFEGDDAKWIEILATPQIEDATSRSAALIAQTALDPK